MAELVKCAHPNTALIASSPLAPDPPGGRSAGELDDTQRAEAGDSANLANSASLRRSLLRGVVSGETKLTMGPRVIVSRAIHERLQ
jgi:hypothetical protein